MGSWGANGGTLFSGSISSGWRLRDAELGAPRLRTCEPPRPRGDEVGKGRVRPACSHAAWLLAGPMHTGDTRWGKQPFS